jgi:hypothetical protein
MDAGQGLHNPAHGAHAPSSLGPLVVDVFGDSIAWTLVRYLPSNGALDIRDHTMLGCGITRAAPYRYFGQTYPRV